MKKILLTLTVALTAAVTTLAQQRIVTETEVQLSDLSKTITHHLYDANGNLVYSLVEETSTTSYTYNALNQVEREVYTDLVNSNNSRNYVYTYNEQGQVASVEKLAGERSLSIENYTYDEHGNIATVTSAVLPLPITYVNTYDEQGNLTSYSITFMGRPIDEVNFTYDDGLLIKEESVSAGKVTTYSYDENGQLISEEVSIADVSVSATTYEYAEIDAALVPVGLQAEANADNTVTLTWDGTATAVLFDGQWIEVEGTSYTSPVLTDGLYSFFVVNAGNAAIIENIEVTDNTKVGVSNVALNGNITVSTREKENASGELVQVVTYNIPISWELPDDAEPIGYRIYYNSQYYVDVEDGSLRSYVIPAENITIWSGEVVTLPFEIRVIAIYETGQAEPDAVLPLDTESILALGISSTAHDKAAETEVFTVGGVRLSSQSLSTLPSGTYILRQGRTARKIVVRE